MTDMSALIDAPVRYDLGESTCPPLTLSDIADPAELAGLSLGYGTSRGDPVLRELIAADTGVAGDDVLVTVGGVQAMSLLAQVVCPPGARVVLPTPCFPPARTVPESLGVHVDTVPLSFDHGYRLDVDRLAAAVTPDTRLISLASPQNPSGVRITRAELLAVLDLAPDAVVLVDETYRDATYGEKPEPSSADLGPRVVTCSSLSKAFGTPGLRLGWLTATDPGLYEKLRAAKFNTTIACSNVDEFLAVQVLRRRPEILASRIERLAEGLDQLLRWVRYQPFEIVRPDGGALCCLRLADIGGFYDRLAAREVRVAPGSWFGESDHVFRVGFGHLSAYDMGKALELMAASL